MSDSDTTASRPSSRFRRILQFSLRTWFVLLSLSCLVVFLGHRAWLRDSLQKTIVAEATLKYDGKEWHARTHLISRMGMRGGSFPTGPQPQVELRDSSFPWISRWSGGSAVFCPFDSIQYSVSNVPIPDWTNRVLATGELRRVSMRLNNPDIDWSLLIGCRALEELSLWGRPSDPQALRGLHQLRKLVKLNLITISNLEYESLLPEGLPPNLIDIRLVDCKLSSPDVLILSSCRKLESLDVTSNPIDLQALAEVGLPPNLKTVRLQRTHCGSADLPLLAGCKQLRKLNLSGHGVDLCGLDGLELPRQLEHLNVAVARLDASTFRWFSQLPNLKTLSIAGCQFEDVDAKGIVLSSTVESVKFSQSNAGIHVRGMLANRGRKQD